MTIKNELERSGVRDQHQDAPPQKSLLDFVSKISILLDQYGIKNVVAIMGTALTTGCSSPSNC